jgi:hypothetical protein
MTSKAGRPLFPYKNERIYDQPIPKLLLNRKAYNRRRFVVQDLLDLFHNFIRQAREHFQRFQILRDLLGAGSAEDDSRGVGVSRDPGESQRRRGSL